MMTDTNMPGNSTNSTLDKTEPNSRRLWLVRHGATMWNHEQRYCGHTDIPLSPAGRTQARWLARRLHTQRIATIYSSDLLRARQTAQIIAAQSLQPVQITHSPAWREIAFGTWEGLTYDQISQQGTPDFFSDPLHASPPGGESLPDLAQRVQQAFLALAQQSAHPLAPPGDLVLVSHGGPLRVLLCRILGMSLEHQWQLCLQPGSLSAIDLLPITLETIPKATLVLLNVQRPVRTKPIPLSRKIPSAVTTHNLPGGYVGGTIRHA